MCPFLGALFSFSAFYSGLPLNIAPYSNSYAIYQKSLKSCFLTIALFIAVQQDISSLNGKKMLHSSYRGKTGNAKGNMGFKRLPWKGAFGRKHNWVEIYVFTFAGNREGIGRE